MPNLLDAKHTAGWLSMLPAGDGSTIEISSPLDGEPIAAIPQSSAEQISAAFSKARVAQQAWQKVPLTERVAVMNRLHQKVIANRELLCDVIQIENGKARADAHNEILDISQNIRYYNKVAPKLLKRRRVAGVFPLVTVTYVDHVPVGVVGLITPWNYPLCLSVSDAVPALLAGNAIVCKPDVQTMFSTLAAVQLWREAGLPEDLFQVVAGDGAVVGPQIVEQADYVMFTGSTPVGRGIAKRAGERLIGCSLELGGKNSLIVMPDADPKKAAEHAVIGAFSNSGQLCIGTERIVVHHQIAAEFEREFVAKVEALKLSSEVGWHGDMGPLISAKQLARVESQVADAVGKGATVLTGGQRRTDIGPLMYAPTVLKDVTNQMELCSTETFGPVCAIYEWRNENELLEFVNGTSLGLAAAIIGKNRAACEKIASRIHAGGISINDPYAAAFGSVAAGMGGFKESGIGRRHGEAGLLKFTESRAIARQRFVKLRTQFGLSHEGWAKLSTQLVQLLKRLGFR